MIPYSSLVHCTGGVLVLLNAKRASKLPESAPEPAQGLIDSWEAEVFREKLRTVPEKTGKTGETFSKANFPPIKGNVG